MNYVWKEGREEGQEGVKSGLKNQVILISADASIRIPKMNLNLSFVSPPTITKSIQTKLLWLSFVFSFVCFNVGFPT